MRRGSGLGTGIELLSGSLKRLTAPAPVAEDTESTVVFLYSKEKTVRPYAPFDWSALWRNVTL
jgi:hypothetical protein